MKTSQQLLSEFRALDSRTQEELLSALQLEFESKSRVIEHARQDIRQSKEKPDCHYCGHEKVYKRGLRKGVQQYTCANCKRWFTEHTGTVLQGIHHPEKWQEYLRLMQEGGSIKGIAKQMGISIETSFRWRHKILSSLGQKEVHKLGKVVECDEMEFVMNNKGAELDRPARRRSSDANKASHRDTTRKVQAVVAVDRLGNKHIRVAEAERLNADMVRKAIGKKLRQGSTLITDKHPAFIKYAKGLKTINHKTIKATDQRISSDKNVSIQRVNQTHKQIRDFMRRFNGGVATKYLQNYMNWYLYQEELKDVGHKLKAWAWVILSSQQGLAFYHAIRENEVNIVT
jgi:transposase-like protein